MINRVEIFDLDGTVVCSLHRYKTMPCGTRIDLDHWRANSTPEMISRDSLLPLADYYKQALADESCYVIVATARVMGDADRAFLRDKLGWPDYLICRDENDSQSGVTLKAKGLRKFFNLKNFRNAKFRLWEDNKTQLEKICALFPGRLEGKFVPSLQGH